MGENVETAGTEAPSLFPTQQTRTGARSTGSCGRAEGTLGSSGAEIKESRRTCLTESLFLQRSLFFLQFRAVNGEDV